MKDLNSLILNPIGGLVLIEATGVNNAGEIIASGFVNDSATGAFILNPVSAAVPEPSSAALIVVGLIAAILRRGDQHIAKCREIAFVHHALIRLPHWISIVRMT